MSKFKVGDKAVLNCDYSDNFMKNTKVTITYIAGTGQKTMVGIKRKDGLIGSCYISRLNPVKNSKKQRITSLEKTVDQQGKEINELKLIVEQLRKAYAVDDVLIKNEVIEFEGKKYQKVDREATEGDIAIPFGSEHPYITNGKPYKLFKGSNGELKHTADSGSEYIFNNSFLRGWKIYEPIKQDVQHQTVPCAAIKTPNELRAEIIEKAKGFIVNYSNGEQRVPWKNGKGQWFLRNFKFVVNESKRTIVVLCKSHDDKTVFERGIAKCMPSDVFNEHIGKAIALGRALGLDVSEFEQAVQPTFEIGQYFEFITRDDEIVSFQVVKVDGEKVWFMNEEGRLVWVSEGWSSDGKYSPKIINDTNAQYGGAITNETF